MLVQLNAVSLLHKQVHTKYLLIPLMILISVGTIECYSSKTVG